MTTVSRRAFFRLTAAVAAIADSAKVGATKARAPSLPSITTGVQPIAAQEHSARIAKVQTVMQQRRIAGVPVVYSRKWGVPGCAAAATVLHGRQSARHEFDPVQREAV